MTSHGYFISTRGRCVAWTLASLFILCAAGLWSSALAQAQAPAPSTRTANNNVIGNNGAELFMNYCASCHGYDGKGGGNMAKVLKTPPADLTTIARRNGGTFPTERVRNLIAGPPNLFIPAHGVSDMPVWGPVFRALDPSGDNEKRLDLIVTYLEFLQVK